MQYSRKLCENIAIKVVNIICQKCIILGLKRACKQYSTVQRVTITVLHVNLFFDNNFKQGISLLCTTTRVFVQGICTYCIKIARFANSSTKSHLKTGSLLRNPEPKTMSFISIIVDGFVKTWKFMCPIWDNLFLPTLGKNNKGIF